MQASGSHPMLPSDWYRRIIGEDSLRTSREASSNMNVGEASSSTVRISLSGSKEPPPPPPADAAAAGFGTFAKDKGLTIDSTLRPLQSDDLLSPQTSEGAPLVGGARRRGPAALAKGMRNAEKRAEEAATRYAQFTLQGVAELVRTGRIEDDGFAGEGRFAMLFFSVLLPIMVIAYIVLFALGFATGWLLCSIVVNGIIISGLTRMRLGKKRDVLPSWIIESFGFLWFIAAIMEVCASAGEISASAGWIEDFWLDMLFAILAMCLLGYLQYLKSARLHLVLRGQLLIDEVFSPTTWSDACLPMVRSKEAFGKSCQNCTVRCSCWTGFFLFGLPSAVVALACCYHSGKTLSMLAAQTDARSSACSPDGVCLSYRCEGPIHHNAIAVVVNGFAATSDSYHYVRFGGRAVNANVESDGTSFTRTCVLDPRGSGFSTFPPRALFRNQPSFGFEEDAMDVKTIIDAEFDRLPANATGAPIARADRVAVLAGHSRGRLVAIKFRARYLAEYKQVVVIGLDGVRTCAPISSSFEDDLQMSAGLEFPDGFVRYVITPLMPFAAGFIDLALDWASPSAQTNFFAGDDVSSLPPALVTLLPTPQQRALQHKFTLERFWLTNAIVRWNWENRYDGPSETECENATAAAHAFLSIRASDVCLARTADGGQFEPTPLIAGFDAIVPSVPRAPDGECADDPAFIDANGYDCTGWVGFDCLAAVSTYAYTPAAMDALLGACPAACDYCALSPAPPTLHLLGAPPASPPPPPPTSPPLPPPPSLPTSPLPPTSPTSPPSPPAPLSDCDQVGLRTNLDTLATDGTDAPTCFQLDDSHQAMADAHGDCEQYYSTANGGLSFKLCRWVGSMCKSTQPFTCTSSDVPSRALAERTAAGMDKDADTDADENLVQSRERHEAYETALDAVEWARERALIQMQRQLQTRPTYCAEHTTLVQLDSFATVASSRIGDFLTANVNTW